MRGHGLARPFASPLIKPLLRPSLIESLSRPPSMMSVLRLPPLDQVLPAAGGWRHFALTIQANSSKVNSILLSFAALWATNRQMQGVRVRSSLDYNQTREQAAVFRLHVR